MSFTPGEVLRAILRARRELGLRTYVRPRIRAVYYQEEDDFLLVVVADRPDKSAVLGPGGRVLKLVRDLLGISSMAVRSNTDLLVKRRRIGEALYKVKHLLARANGLLKMALERILAILRAELRYPPREWPSYEPLDEPAIVIGFSGGADSTAMLYVAKVLGLNPIAATVDAGSWMLPAEARELISSITSRLGVEHAYLRGRGDVFSSILRLAGEGRRHPCRMCHQEIEREVVRFSLEEGVPMVGFGDLLPTGRFSTYWLRVGSRKVLRLNLMAALALFKTDTLYLATRAGRPRGRLSFGCPLLKATHRKYKYMMLPSIQRVLREARAGILEPNQALELIKSIIRS
ncbi:MAG TPA: hypothetical protein ENF78_02395 [Candidatus Bathyarchaeota archaeon]|nr:hypothetical protein [Candidatus Bathyarchaeota archaeon]